MAKIKVVLRWNANSYLPSELKKLPIKEVRKEYSRLRSIERKRMDRMKGTEFEKSDTFKRNYKAYKPVKELNDTELLYQTAKLAREVSKAGNTLTEAKELKAKKLETLQSHGYSFVNDENFFDFVKFMDEYRARKLDEIYDSDSVAEMYEITEGLKINPSKIYEDFGLWLKKQKEAQALYEKYGKSKSKHRYEFYKKELNKPKRKARRS